MRKNIETTPIFAPYLEQIEPSINYYNSLSSKNYTTLNSDPAHPEKCQKYRSDFKEFFKKNKLEIQKNMNESDFKTLDYILFADISSPDQKNRDNKTNYKWSENVHYTIRTKMTLNGNFYGRFGSSHIRYSIHAKGTFSKIITETKSSYFYRNVVLCNTAYLNSYRGYKSEKIDAKNTDAEIYKVPIKNWKKIRGTKYRFHKWKLQTKHPFEIVERKFRNFKGSFILFIRNDEPADGWLKFCGDKGW